jgi:hypothetical protein
MARCSSNVPATAKTAAPTGDRRSAAPRSATPPIAEAQRSSGSTLIGSSMLMVRSVIRP